MKHNGFLYIVLLFISFGIGILIQSIHITTKVQKPVVIKIESVATLSAVPSVSLTATPTPTGMVLPLIFPGEWTIKVPILLYHYISVNPYKDDKTRNGLSTPPGIFDQQLKLLTDNGFTTITFDEMAAAFDGKIALPPKPIILTFDDGYVDFYFNAHPLLQKYNMKVVAFISTGLIGGGAYMTWSQIDELVHSPNVVLEAHSVHHYALNKVNQQVLQNEVVESKQVLEKHTGYTVNWMAYPYGSFNDAVVSAVKKSGYIGAITTVSGIWQYKSRFFYIPRYRAGTRVGNDLLKIIN